MPELTGVWNQCFLLRADFVICGGHAAPGNDGIGEEGQRIVERISGEAVGVGEGSGVAVGAGVPVAEADAEKMGEGPFPQADSVKIKYMRISEEMIFFIRLLLFT